MHLIATSLAVLATLRTASGHARIADPVPINLAGDTTYNAPLTRGFSNFPCKGYHTMAFDPTAAWKAGEMASFTIDTSHIAPHGGGSCQASISHDGGGSFQVLHSFIGDCPRGAHGNELTDTNQTFYFKIPEDEPAGNAIFAWTWFNSIGNREMYMNCAFVTVQNDNPVSQVKARPAMFIGAMGSAAKDDKSDDCYTPENVNLQFPDPGEFVTDGTQNPGIQFTAKQLPIGDLCGDKASGGGISISGALGPNKELAGGNGGAVAGPKPIQNPDTSPTTTTAMSTMVTSMSIPSADHRKVVYITEVLTQSVVDIVTVTATTYLPSPTDGGVAKRHEHITRGESCSFQETFKVGNKCPVPSVQSSRWDACVWREFCPCLNDNLDNDDIVNFVQVKRYCDCVTNGIGCPKTVRSRHMQRHTHSSGVDIVLRRRREEDSLIHTYRV
ncbi:hypothetical protein TWF481_006447 [Arthrobotrys musiformis]|uniref:Lytic polysaccharide monooxygenase n=1 Tax=Arthrobotrys musiformis TaxID=47236 RepID=A0AAV9WIS1_9PEZI